MRNARRICNFYPDRVKYNVRLLDGFLVIMLQKVWSILAQRSGGTIAQISPPANFKTIWELVENAMPTLSGLAFVVFFGLLVYAGYLYMMSAGDSNKIKTANSVLQAAFIGLLIVLASLLITNVVKEVLGV